jgi:hypothetical protein
METYNDKEQLISTDITLKGGKKSEEITSKAKTI